jgi:hypothetical protein
MQFNNSTNTTDTPMNNTNEEPYERGYLTGYERGYSQGLEAAKLANIPVENPNNTITETSNEEKQLIKSEIDTLSSKPDTEKVLLEETYLNEAPVDSPTFSSNLKGNIKSIIPETNNQQKNLETASSMLSTIFMSLF